jgi:hypothetical protein
MLMSTEPFASMKPKARTRLIHRESLIVGFEPDEAIAALPKLIPTQEEQRRALDLCWEIAGPRQEMSPETLAMMERLAKALGYDQDKSQDQGETGPKADPGPSRVRKAA